MARKTTTTQDPVSDSNLEAAPQATTIESTEATPNVVISACGGALKQAREKLKLSIHDVSSSLRLSDKQIEAMEADRFDLLPQPSIVRGFIRNYAKAVKIDATPIIAAYNARVPETAPQSFTVKSNTTQSVIGEHKAGFSPAVFLGLMVLFGAIAIGFYYYTQHIRPNANKAETAAAAKTEELNVDVTANSVSTDFALPTAQRQTATDNPEMANETAVTSEVTNSTELALPTTNATPPNTTSSAAPSATAVANPSIENASLPSDVAISRTLTPPTAEAVASANAVSNTLLIRATEETWVNIVNSRGKQIYSKVLSKGQTDSLEATPPLKLTVGNAQHTSLIYNGQAIDLSAHTRNKVARLTLSE